jgi:hypothetical protein
VFISPTDFDVERNLASLKLLHSNLHHTFPESNFHYSSYLDNDVEFIFFGNPLFADTILFHGFLSFNPE